MKVGWGAVNNRIIQFPLVFSGTGLKQGETTAASQRVPNMLPGNLQWQCGKI